MSESAGNYGIGPGMVVGRTATEPKTKVQLALALGRTEERIVEIRSRLGNAIVERDEALRTIRDVEAILEGPNHLHVGYSTTRAHRLARDVVADAAGAKRVSQAYAKELAVIAEALDRGATLTKVGPEAGYVCERGLLRCTGSTPVAAAEAFLKEEKAPAAEAKPQ